MANKSHGSTDYHKNPVVFSVSVAKKYFGTIATCQSAAAPDRVVVMIVLNSARIANRKLWQFFGSKKSIIFRDDPNRMNNSGKKTQKC